MCPAKNAPTRLIRWVGAAAAALCSVAALAQPTLTWDTVVVSPQVAEYPYYSLRLSANRFVSIGVADSTYYDSTTHLVLNGLLYLTDRRGRVLRKHVRRVPPGSFGDLVNLMSTRNGFDALTLDPSAVAGRYGSTRWLSFDSLGNISRERVLPDTDSIDRSWSRAVGLPGGLVTVGYKVDVSRNYQAEVRRFNEAGQVQWEQRLGYWARADFLVPLLDGSYALITTDPTQFGVVSQNRFRYDYKLYRLTASGGVLDSAWVGVAAAWEGPFQAKATTDGGLIICGFESPSPSSNPRRGTLIKLDSTFQQQWKYTMTAQTGDAETGAEIRDAWETTVGTYVINGQGAPFSFLREIRSPTMAGQQPAMLWAWNYPLLAAPQAAWPHHLLYEPDGVVYGFGTYTANSNHPTFQDEDFYQARLTGLPTPAVLDYCRRPPSRPRATMTALTVDSLRFTVQQAGQTAGPRYAEITLVEWDFGDGSPPAQGWQVDHRFRTPAPVAVRLRLYNNLGCSRDSVFYPYGVPPPPNGLPDPAAAMPFTVQVYPNPAPGGRYRLHSTATGRYTITDALGRTVATGSVAADVATELNLSQYAAGLYNLRVVSNTSGLAVRKLLR